MSIEAMKLALEALENFARFQRMMRDGPDASDKLLAEDYAEAGFMKMAAAIPALRAALAEQPQQEPVAWMWKDGTITSDPDRADGTWTPLYTSPPASKPWVGLTDDEVAVMMMEAWGCSSIAPRHAPAFARAIEAKLREKNT